MPTKVPDCGPSIRIFTSPLIDVADALESLTVQVRLTTAPPLDASTVRGLKASLVTLSLPPAADAAGTAPVRKIAPSAATARIRPVSTRRSPFIGQSIPCSDDP